jgi:Phosphotransferase enzyme family
MPAVPNDVDDLTPEWLTAALQQRYPELTVTTVRVEEVIWGTATKVRLQVGYDASPPSAGPPVALCVKGGFDERLLDFGTTRAYRLEAGFFRDVAPGLEIPLPACWFAAIDEDRGTGVLVLDDLVAAGASFGDPRSPWPVDRVAAALEVAAAWHAATWGDSFARPRWLPPHSIVADLSPVLAGSRHWDTHFAHAEAPEPQGPLADRERVAAALATMWRHHAVSAVCLSHGDAHLGNTFLAADGQPAFLDWQALCAGPPLDDVAYFVTGALSIPDRRIHEGELLRHYLRALSAAGAPAPEFDGAWLDYRRFSLHGFLWALTPPVMQSWEKVRAMAERHMAAILDLDALGALEANSGPG